MAELNMRVDDTPRGLIVKIAGEVAVGEVDEMEQQLQALTTRRTPTFVLDLSGLTFAASLAIGCLLRFRSTVTAAGGRVVLADVQPNVHETFRRAQLHRVFTIYPTVREALSENVVT